MWGGGEGSGNAFPGRTHLSSILKEESRVEGISGPEATKYVRRSK